MSDQQRPDLPYEKAITETAKATGKVVDLVDKASPAIGTIYNWMIGDRIVQARERNLDQFQRKTKRIICERDLADKTTAIPESLALPLLEAAQGEPRDELQEVLAALLANAMDPNCDDIVRPEFVETVRRWQPIDILAMKHAMECRETSKPYFNEGDLIGANDLRQSAVALSLEHLVNLNCLRHNPSNGYIITAYGQEIMIASSATPPLEAKKGA